jgi:hypothetical protein
VAADQAFKVARSYIAQTHELKLGFGKALLGKRIGEDQLLARLRAEIIFSLCDLIKPVGNAVRK